MKVLFITNIPAPYTVDFFNELGKKADLTVLFEKKTTCERNDEWYSENASEYRSEFITKRNDIKRHLNGLYDFVIIGNYASWFGISAIRYMKKRHIPFYIHVDGGIVNKDNFIKYAVKRYLMTAASGFFSSGAQTDKYIKHYCKNAEILNYPFTSVGSNDMSDRVLSHEEKLRLRDPNKYKEKYVALFVGQFVHRKGLDVLIEAAQYINSDVGIYCLGGDPTDEMTNRINTLGLKNICFLGFTPPSETLEEIRKADMLVLPTRYDIWGLVVNEALSQCTPVISTDMSVAALELINDGENGFIVPSEDSIALADAVNKMAEDVVTLDRMIAACLPSIENYTIENMAEVYYSNICEFYEARKKLL